MSKIEYAIENTQFKLAEQNGELKRLVTVLKDDLDRIYRAVDSGTGILNSCGEIQGRGLTFDLVVKEIVMLDNQLSLLKSLKDN